MGWDVSITGNKPLDLRTNSYRDLDVGFLDGFLALWDSGSCKTFASSSQWRGWGLDQPENM